MQTYREMEGLEKGNAVWSAEEKIIKETFTDVSMLYARLVTKTSLD